MTTVLDIYYTEGEWIPDKELNKLLFGKHEHKDSIDGGHDYHNMDETSTDHSHKLKYSSTISN